MQTLLWVDAAAGVAGDMLAAALVDAGAPLGAMQAAVDAVFPGGVRLTASPVQRAGLHALHFEVTVLEADAPHRNLADILAMLDRAPEGVRQRAVTVFERLAAAEARAHGIQADAVHFHEVGAADSIADIVSVCAGLEALGISDFGFGQIALGSGSVRTAHGVLPVPTPAALTLCEGISVTSGGDGELATPTGLALLTALGVQQDMPSMQIMSVGIGGGTKDFAERSNVVRALVGTPADDILLLETNIDDMDPRLWPAAISALMTAGAQDAWLTPIIMKKGRPAHTLSVLCRSQEKDRLLEVMFRETTTIGVRTTPVSKVALERTFATVQVHGQDIAVKVAGRNGRIYNVSLEFEDLARAAAELGVAQRALLDDAEIATERAGLIVGEAFPG